MSNPFKKIINNSNTTKKIWSEEKIESKTDTKKCNSCGAARPKETNLTTCDYCGFKFMTIDAKIKTDK